MPRTTARRYIAAVSVARPVVAIHQPNYLPWLGWFAKAAAADVLVLYDDVQFEKGGYTNRVEVKTAQGRTRLTVPVHVAGEPIPRIDAIAIADPRWAQRHVKTLEQSYRRCPGWRVHGQRLAGILTSGETSLARMNEALLRALLDAFAIGTRIVRSSDLGPRGTRGSAALVDVCRRAGAATYLSGAGGRKYNDPTAFDAAGIGLAYSAFAHPVHAQPHGPFESGLSAVDLLFSAPEEAPALLRAGIGEPTR
jgi:hypothetical protein